METTIMGKFQKGHRGFWLGKKKPHTQKTKDKIREALLGHSVSAETREKIGLAHIGNKYSVGLKRSEEMKEKISQTLKRKGIEPKVKFIGVGKNSARWITDRTQLQKSDRHLGDSASNDWRKRTYVRDRWKCRISNKDCSGRIEAHHILNWVDYPELRYEINNGITLCHAHHPRGRKNEKQLEPILQALILK